MIADPERRGRALAAFHRDVTPRLWRDVRESGALPPLARPGAAARAEREWECFALYACVRGLIAAGGFNRETAAAVDALHEAVMETWRAEPETEAHDARRARVSERYAEYGAIGQEGGAAGAATVAARLGAACARHLAEAAGRGVPRDVESLAEWLGELHESIATGAAEAVRIAT